MTTDNPIRILLIEDNPGDVRLIEEILSDARRIKTDLSSAGSLEQGMALLSGKPVDLLLLDLNLPDSHGLASLDKLTQAFPELPIVIMTGLDDEEIGVRAMGAGAQDYIVKGSVKSESLERVIRYAIERSLINQRFQKSEARFRKLIEKNADGVLIILENGTIAFANDSCETICGHKKADLIGGPFGFPVIPKKVSEIEIVHNDMKKVTAELRAVDIEWEGSDACLISVRDVTERKQHEIEREKLIAELKNALAEIKTLSGLLPICSYCKKIRDDKGYWNQIEAYIQKHSEAEFSHSICKDCAEKFFPDMDIYE